MVVIIEEVSEIYNGVLSEDMAMTLIIELTTDEARRVEKREGKGSGRHATGFVASLLLCQMRQHGP